MKLIPDLAVQFACRHLLEMPFTFSHPYVILPFKRWSGKWFSMTALTLGSMVPDFEFFIRMKAEAVLSHTVKGMSIFNLPLVVVLSFLYHCWVRNPLLQNLPDFLRRRLSKFTLFNWPRYVRQNWLAVFVSALLGTFSHYVCDDFTHGYGWFAKNIPVLAASYYVMGKFLPGFHLLQYLSSLVMGLLLMRAALKLPLASGYLQENQFYLYWTIVVGIAALSFCVRFSVGASPVSFGSAIMTGIASGLLGLIVASTVVNLMKRRDTNW
ncbi:MAG: DUF4184 family protein [Rufibacter sp.]